MTSILSPSASASASASTPEIPVQAAGWITGGTPAYRRAGWALFLAGFASFSLIYCVQPLLPAFAHAFAVSPAQSSLALSLTTGCLALSILLSGVVSQMLGRREVMVVSMLAAAVLNIVAALAPGWHGLLAARALEGFVLGGVPAVAMAWLAEEIDPRHLGKAMGLYVGGTAFGAMIGRIGMGMVTEVTSWRVALGGLGVLCLLAVLGFWLLLPRSRNFVPHRGVHPAVHGRIWMDHLRNRGLLRVFAIGFVLTSIFVTLFNYATFRLSAPPYGLGQLAISLIFLSYGFGIVSSSVAGAMADRFGRRPLLLAGFAVMLAGVLLTLLAPLEAVIGGILLVTTGFFICHSVSSSSIGPLAGAHKGHAAALHLLIYYCGASFTGSFGGWVWQGSGWPGIVVLTGGLAGLGLLLALRSGQPHHGGNRHGQQG